MNAAYSLTCVICKNAFGCRSSLRVHVKKFHPGKLVELAPIPKKDVKCTAICKVCSKGFVTKSNLIRHIKSFHKDQQHILLKPKNYPFECNICHRHFSYSKHLKFHMKCHNKQEQGNNFGVLKCVLCKSNAETETLKKSDLFVHFEKRHDIKLVTDTFEFSSFEEFEDWKRQEEKRIHESFVKARGPKKNKIENSVKIKYVCHRSGIYKSEGSGKRRLKTQGSKKINGFCPAEMLLEVIDGKCNLKYLKTHVGHSSDLVHLNLSETDRKSLATQIASQIPFEKILEQVRQSKCNGTLERTHLLKRKDLHNIKQSLKINKESLRPANDAISVDPLGTKMEEDPVNNKEERKTVNTSSNTRKCIDRDKKLQLEKDKIKHSVMSIIDKISSFQELDTLRRLIAPIEATFAATRQEEL